MRFASRACADAPFHPSPPADTARCALRSAKLQLHHALPPPPPPHQAAQEHPSLGTSPPVCWRLHLRVLPPNAPVECTTSCPIAHTLTSKQLGHRSLQFSAWRTQFKFRHSSSRPNCILRPLSFVARFANLNVVNCQQKRLYLPSLVSSRVHLVPKLVTKCTLRPTSAAKRLIFCTFVTMPYRTQSQ